MSVRVGVKSKGPLNKKHAPVILDSRHMRAVGETIAAPLRENLARGLDADGKPLPPEVGGGDGIPGHETGALAASIAPRRTSKGKLVVMPDYRKYLYGVFLTRGVDKVATLEAIIAGKMRKRRDYKTLIDRKQVKRPFLGMSRATLEQVADANARQFGKWLEGKP